MAIHHLWRPGHSRLRAVPDGRAYTDAGKSRILRRRVSAGNRDRTGKGGGRDHQGRGRREIPDLAASRSREILPAKSQRLRPLAARDEKAAGEYPDFGAE